MDNLKNICLTYFKTFSNQDLDGLRKLLSEDCYLRDFENENIRGMIFKGYVIIFRIDSENKINSIRAYKGN